MLGRIIKTVANQYLRDRRARTGSGPGRLPPTSLREAQHRAVNSVVQSLIRRFMGRR